MTHLPQQEHNYVSQTTQLTPLQKLKLTFDMSYARIQRYLFLAPKQFYIVYHELPDCISLEYTWLPLGEQVFKYNHVTITPGRGAQIIVNGVEIYIFSLLENCESLCDSPFFNVLSI